jgi:hypothetical protein
MTASDTVASPLRKKNAPIRKSASLSRMGYRAYIWKTAMRLKAPKTPRERATTIGTPYFGRPYRRGVYANEAHGEAKALCHVSDLFAAMSLLTVLDPIFQILTKIQSNCLPYTKDRTELDYSCNEAVTAKLSKWYKSRAAPRMRVLLGYSGALLGEKQIMQRESQAASVRWNSLGLWAPWSGSEWKIRIAIQSLWSALEASLLAVCPLCMRGESVFEPKYQATSLCLWQLFIVSTLSTGHGSGRHTSKVLQTSSRSTRYWCEIWGDPEGPNR